MYTIQIDYTTGDSFNSYNETDKIGHVWDSLEDAKQGLKDIAAHWKYVNSLERWFDGEVVKYGEWICKDFKYPSDEELVAKSYLYIFTGEGNERVKISAFWVGCFENLIEARIVVEDDIDDELTFTPY